MGGYFTKTSFEKKIVVVGGGYAGAFLAVQLLSADADFILIDEKKFFYHCVASVRAVVDTRMTKNLFVPYDKTFGDHFMQGRVKNINTSEKKVVLENGDEVNYEILILATGSSTHAPYKCDPDISVDEQAVRQQISTCAEKIKNSQDIIIVGGGAIGCEVAAEIRSLYKNKNITLIHASEELVLKGAASGFHSTLRNKLKQKNIKLILGKKVTNLNELGDTGPFQGVTDDGNTYQTDLVLPCTGITKTDLTYATNLGAECFDDRGLLKVNEYLQVYGHEDLFALGDCCNADNMKTALYLEKQIPIVLHNIRVTSDSGAMKKFKAERGPNHLIGVSLGPDDGTGLTAGGWTIPAFLVTMTKSRDMVVGKYWKELGQKPPKE